jgi:hypothetical protein
MADRDPGSRNGPRVNPIVQDLLAEGSGKVLTVGGFVGPTTDENIRLYSDLSLSTYIEIARTDVVRVVEVPDKPEQPCIVFLKSTAELKFVQEASFRAEHVLSAIASVCPGCGDHGGAPRAAAQQTGGGGGPTIDLCAWACVERYRLCAGPNATSWQRFWCAAAYLYCRLTCGTGPIIV